MTCQEQGHSHVPRLAMSARTSAFIHFILRSTVAAIGHSMNSPHSSTAGRGPSKRRDLQGIRGLAILFVLMFHLKPTLFPAGFVGVDMFFVLSGFLMSMIQSRKFANMSNFIDFYRRRFIRIVPIYYVILTFVYIGSWFLLFADDKKQLLSDLQWALSFTSNIQPLYDNTGYWDRLSSYRFLAHTWSLGVELQFYLLAPLILGKFIFKKQRSRMAAFSVLVAASLCFQLFSSEHSSHGLLPSRIWQFLCGSLAFEYSSSRSSHFEVSGKYGSDKENAISLLSLNGDDSRPNTTRTYVIVGQTISITALICLVLSGTNSVSDTVLRIGATVVTALLTVHPCSFLGHSLLVYIGDISYSLYLIHWPVIVAVKYYMKTQVMASEIYVMVPAMIAITVLFYHKIENVICRTRLLVSSLVVLFCGGLILSTGYYYSTSTFTGFNSKDSSNSVKINYTAVIEWNIRESKKDYYDMPCKPDTDMEKWTHFTLEPQLRCLSRGNGTAKILLLGNSIAYRAFPLIHSILRGRHSELRLFSRSGCPPICNECPDVTAGARAVVDRMRPDIIMHIHNVHTIPPSAFQKPVVDWNTDEMFIAFQRNFDYFKARSKFVVIDMPYYVSEIRVASEIASRLKQNITNFDDLKVSKKEDLEQQEHHRARIQRLDCTNCIINPINELSRPCIQPFDQSQHFLYVSTFQALFDGHFYYFYNRTSLLAITSDGMHLTPEGLNLVRPTYEKILEDLLPKIEIPARTV